MLFSTYTLEMFVFKLWTASRDKKISVVIQTPTNLLPVLIAKGNEKLQINGNTIVLESDGTVLDEDESLLYFANEPLMLLQTHELWYSRPILTHEENENLQTSSTDINVSGTSNSETNCLNQTIEDDKFENSVESHHVDPPIIQENVAANSNNSIEGNKTVSNETGTNVEQESAASITSFLQAKKEAFSSWESYEVPWENIDPLILGQLDTGSKDPLVLKEIVHAVVRDMKFYQISIPMAVYTQVAIQLVNRFPNSLEDRHEDGTRFDCGYLSIRRKLMEHSNYVNRPHKRASLLNELDIPLKLRKASLAFRSGCPNWQPDSQPPGTSSDSIEKYRLYLNELNFKEIPQDDDATWKEIDEAMEHTFVQQRLFVNNLKKIPKVPDIIHMWPCLLNTWCMFWHFTKLTECPIERIATTFVKKVPKILVHGQRKNLFPLSSTGNEQHKQQDALEIIISHFKEPADSLIKSFPNNTSLDTIEVPAEYPSLVALEGENSQDPYTFWLMMDGSAIITSETFVEALQLLMCCYFNFNRTYPKHHACTLTFIEMYVCNIQSNENNHRSKSKTVKQKVLTLFNKLNKIDIKDNVVIEEISEQAEFENTADEAVLYVISNR